MESGEGEVFLRTALGKGPLHRPGHCTTQRAAILRNYVGSGTPLGEHCGRPDATPKKWATMGDVEF